MLGLAAGFDKNAVRHRRAGRAGLRLRRGRHGHRPSRSRATRRPRLFRLPADRAVVNRMGFNNDGAEVVAAARLAGSRGATHGDVVVGVNIGKTKVVPEDEAVDDYEKSTRLLAPYADYLVVNVSSPNTPGLRDLQAVEKLAAAAGRRTRRGRLVVTDRHVPLLVKIAPDLTDDDVLAVADLVAGRSASTGSSRPTRRSPRRAAHARPPRSSAPGPAGCPARRCRTARWRCCGCCAARVGPEPHADRRRRHRDRRRRAWPGSPPAPTCCRPTPRSSTRGRLAGQDEPRAGPSYRAGTLRKGRPMKQHDRPFGARLRDAMDDRGPLCVGIDPHPGAARRLGADRLRRRTGAVRADRRRGAGAGGGGAEAAVGVLRAVRVGRDRGAGAGGAQTARPGRRARRCSTSSAATSARPRRRTPTPTSTRASPLAADAVTASPVPRLRHPRPAARDGARARRRGVRARADLQPGGAAGAARPDRRRAQRRRRRARPR